MDRFKFRAWQDSCRQMIDSEAIKMLTGGFDIFSDEEYNIMQCTGLKDKNGVLIFEGDVVKTVTLQPTWAMGERVWQIIFDKSVAQFLLSDNHEQKYMVVYEDLEIIGNIHESPELLK